MSGGHMFSAIIWVAATVAIFAGDSGLVPFLVALTIAFAVAIVRNGKRKSELERLVNEYVGTYGSPPPGFKGGATRTGRAVGAVAGDARIGGLVGVAVDLARAAFAEGGMSEEQKAHQRRIAGMQAWTPFHGLYLLAMWLGLSWGLCWAYDVVRAP